MKDTNDIELLEKHNYPNIYLFLDEKNELLNKKLINFCRESLILDIFNNENKYLIINLIKILIFLLVFYILI